MPAGGVHVQYYLWLKSTCIRDNLKTNFIANWYTINAKACLTCAKLKSTLYTV